MRIPVLVLVNLLLLFPASTRSQSTLTVPNGWQRIDAAGNVIFYLPPDMKKSDVRGIESFFQEYSNGGFRLFLNYQPYDHLAYDSRQLEDAKDYHEETLTIDGRKAWLITYHISEDGRIKYIAELYVGDWPHGEVELVISASSQDVNDLDTAKRIFRFVHLKNPEKGKKES